MKFEGRLSIDEIQERLGVKFTPEFKLLLEGNEKGSGEMEPGKWHCFEEPICFLCGDEALANKIYNHLAYFDTKEEYTIAIHKN